MAQADNGVDAPQWYHFPGRNSLDGTTLDHVTVGNGSAPVETRVHLSRTGSVDIFASSPPRFSKGLRATDALDAEYDRGGPGYDVPTPDHGRGYSATHDTSYHARMESLGLGSGLGGGRASVTSSSKAVLSALKALQEKIKRLESERNAATEECARLRREMERQMQDADTQSRLDTSAAHEKQSSARLAYERLLSDKDIVDAKLGRAEEETHRLIGEVASLRTRLLSEEAARRDADVRAQSLEDRVRDAETALRRLQAREGELMAAVSSERESRRSQRETGSDASRGLEVELQAERRRREELEERKEKIGEVLLAVMDMNQHLAEHLGVGPKKKKKVKKKVAAGTSTTTAAAAAAPPGGGARTAARATARKKPSEVGGTTTSRAGARTAKPAAASAPVNRSGEVLLQLPFFPPHHRKTFNLLATLSEAVRKCKTREPKQVLDALYDMITHDADYMARKSERTAFQGSVPTPGSVARSSFMFAPRERSRHCSRADCEGGGVAAGQGEGFAPGSPYVMHAWSTPKGHDSTYASPSKENAAVSGECDLEGVTQMLQEELGLLNQKEQELKEGGGGGHTQEEAEELGAVLEAKGRKEDELRLLRSGRRKLQRRHRSPVVSPAAARRSEQRMSFLRDVDRVAKLRPEDLTRAHL